jgi:hypothetical protein
LSLQLPHTLFLSIHSALLALFMAEGAIFKPVLGETPAMNTSAALCKISHAAVSGDPKSVMPPELVADRQRVEKVGKLTPCCCVLAIFATFCLPLFRNIYSISAGQATRDWPHFQLRSERLL